MLASVARNAAYYRARMTHDYEPDPVLLERVRQYDPLIDLRWNNEKQQWAVWVRTTEGDIFCRHVGSRLNNDLIEDLRRGDWSRQNADREFFTLAEQERLRHRTETHDVGDIHDKLWHGASCDSDWTARQRKQDILKSEGLNDD